jgi:hypothetical protein
VQLDVDAVGIVEGHGRAVQRRFVEHPRQRVSRPDHAGDPPPVRGGTGSAVVPSSQARRSSGNPARSSGPRLGHRRYRPRLHPPRRRQKVPGTLGVCGLRAFIHVIDRKSRRCHANLRRPGSGINGRACGTTSAPKAGAQCGTSARWICVWAARKGGPFRDRRDSVGARGCDPRPDHPPPTSPESGSSAGPSSAASSANTSEPHRSPGQHQWPSSGTPRAPDGSPVRVPAQVRGW